VSGDHQGFLSWHSNAMDKGLGAHLKEKSFLIPEMSEIRDLISGFKKQIFRLYDSFRGSCHKAGACLLQLPRGGCSSCLAPVGNALNRAITAAYA